MSTVPTTSFATSRPVAVLMIFFAAVVFGYFSYDRLPIRLMPEMSYPTITVRTEYSGAAPEEVEKDISRPIEEALGVISGLRRISSVSRAGVSDVVLEFSWETSMSKAVQDALEKLDLVVLSEDAGTSLILRFDPSLDPVMELSLSSTRPVSTNPEDNESELRRLRRIAELQVKRALEPVKGVAAARVRGGLEEEIHVMLDSGSLTRAGLSVARVIERLQQENINVAGGTINVGGADHMVRTLNEYSSVDEIADTEVTRIEGRSIRIRDLGSVTKSHREREIVTRTDGRESVQIDIFKEADANMVALSKRVSAALGKVGLDASTEEQTNGAMGALPLAEELYRSEQVKLEVVADRSLFIESSIAEVRNTALLGGLMAVLVLFLFLKTFRSTLIIGLSIPISLLVTFAPMNLMGVSLNIMSLGGLALGVGMLVDSSIVVLESIYRNREEGLDLMSATIRGTHEVRAAVVASTLTTIGVFLPMVFVDGVAGQAFGDLGLAVVISLLASLIVALYLLPMLASRGSAKDPDNTTGLMIGVFDVDTPEGASKFKVPTMRFKSLSAFKRDFRSLSWIPKILLALPLFLRLLLTLVLELVSTAVSILVFVPLLFLGQLMVPLLRRGLALLWRGPLYLVDTVLASLRVSYPRFLRWSIHHASAVFILMLLCLGLTYISANRLESELLPEVRQGEFSFQLALPVGTAIEDTVSILSDVETAILSEIEGVESVIVTYGYDAASSQRSDEGEHTATFKLLLSKEGKNAVQEEKVAAAVRERLDKIPDLEARLTRPVLFSFKTPIEVEIYGDDLVRLREFSDRVLVELKKMPQLTDVETSLRPGAPEVQVVYNRDRIRRYQLDVASVARMVRDDVKGRIATRFNRRDRKVPVLVRLGEKDRGTVDDLERLIIDPQASGTIVLSSVADISLGEGPSEVRRVDGRRVAILRANLRSGASLGTTVKRLRERLQGDLRWPSDIGFKIAGQNEEWEQSSNSLWLALALSMFLVYVIMAAQFESLVYPMIIMVTIPMAFLGTFVTLNLLDIHLSIIVFLGMIMLAGIVVNNAIVLVDYINTLKDRGQELEEAVINAGEARLRPILMTTITTALGLLPMAMGMGDGAELRTPLAISVISGLVVSTVLTLIIIPTMVVLVDRTILKLRTTLWGETKTPPAHHGMGAIHASDSDNHSGDDALE